MEIGPTSLELQKCTVRYGGEAEDLGSRKVIQKREGVYANKAGT